MVVIDKSKQTAGGVKFHRVTVGGAGLSAALALPSPTRNVSVVAIGAAARLYFAAADEVAGTKYFECPAGVFVNVPMRTDVLIAQGQGAGTICIATTHDALDAGDAVGADYAAA